MDGSLAATGSMGKKPVVIVWSTNSTNTITTLGLGFFSRGVCAVEISPDNQLVVAVGCDDSHMVVVVVVFVKHFSQLFNK